MFQDSVSTLYTEHSYIVYSMNIIKAKTTFQILVQINDLTSLYLI